MAILLAFLTNLTLTSFISCFILKLNIKNESIKDMIINKKMLERIISQEISIYFHIINIAGWFSLSTAQHFIERKI
jgi:hypothetical protein